ncbi:MAG: gamma-glutamyl-gamma-aminobutyrate hydrolase family protein [Usitatibacter sp.]
MSARLLYPDPGRSFLPTKSIQYLEQSAANWIMSGEVLAFMIPEMSLASPHRPVSLKVKNYVDALDGLLLQGGADMSPMSYGEKPINPLWAGDAVRDQYEIELFHEFVTQGKPVFGICRGHQVINVALGGKLFQDIATQCPGNVVHRDEGKYENHFHDMRILPNTWLSRLYPNVETKRINTIHHQALKSLGEGLVPEALSEPDGLVEAIRWEGHSFVVGVQWHPEFMDPKDPGLIDSRPLLRAFLAACEHRKRTGNATPVMAAKAA